MDYFARQFLETLKDEARSLAFFQMNTRHYPDSSNAWQSLGEAHALRGDKPAAIKAYEQALALDAANSKAAARLAELRQ